MKPTETKVEHTPGPWAATDITTADSLPHRWICGCGSDQAVITQKSGCIANRKEAEANARLIAAAPEMLAALEECISILSRYPARDPNGEVCGDMVPMSAKAALLKAKGGQ